VKVERFFSFRGRLSRLGYWRTMLALQLWAAPAFCLSLFAILAFGSPAGVIITVVFTTYLIAATSCAVRRLHDRGRNGWWLLPMTFGPLLAAALADELLRIHDAAAGWSGLALSVIALLGNLWVWVEIGFKRGPLGANSFGPSAELVSQDS
jgi:uncharacterized membrane protein YhaH (DUF805 family)